MFDTVEQFQTLAEKLERNIINWKKDWDSLA